jgi:hypothetical protein
MCYIVMESCNKFNPIGDVIMKKIDESQKRRFGVLAGLKDPTTAKREEKAEREASRKRVQEHVNRILENDDLEEEVEEAKHTKKGPTHIKGGKSATKNLSEMELGDEDEEDVEGMDGGMDDMGGDMGGLGGEEDMEMGPDDGMGPGAEMGGGDEDLATRIITRVVDAIKAELGVDVSVSSGAPETAVPGAGMEPDMGGGMGDDMGDDGMEPDLGDEDEMLHEDETFKAGGKATRPSVAKVDAAHPDHKLKNVSGKMNESSYRKSLTNEIAKDIAKQALLEFKKSIAAQKKKK